MTTEMSAAAIREKIAKDDRLLGFLHVTDKTLLVERDKELASPFRFGDIMIPQWDGDYALLDDTRCIYTRKGNLFSMEATNILFLWDQKSRISLRRRWLEWRIQKLSKAAKLDAALSVWQRFKDLRRRKLWKSAGAEAYLRAWSETTLPILEDQWKS